MGLENFEKIGETSFCTLYRNQDLKMLMVRYHQGETIDLEKGKKLVEMVYPHIKAGLLLGITDATAPYLQISRETREYYSNNKSMQITRAHAVVVNDLHTRLLVNFFIRFDKPVIPVRLFTSFEKAIDWLIKQDEILQKTDHHKKSESV